MFRGSSGNIKLTTIDQYTQANSDKIDKLALCTNHSTVTDLARFLGLSTSVPLIRATW